MKEVLKSCWQSVANEYDERSLWNKGERQTHLFYLEALLLLKKQPCHSFLELGCGTGFFTESFYKIFPDINGLLVDGSSAMLSIATDRIKTIGGQAGYLCKPLQELDILHDLIHPFDIVFSALTIHHLAAAEKRTLFDKIYNRLQTDGCFILYDIFKSTDDQANSLFEQLSCLHMREKLKLILNLDIDIDELSLGSIISKDRANKVSEGDCESSVEDHLIWLKEAGFSHVCTFYQENRFFGIIASK
jgi:tRNA (cmo5U34)-methyltransferase